MKTRRQFLGQSAPALALAAWLRPSRTGSSSGPSLGFSLYGMKTVPPVEALRQCAAIGYRNVELALNKGYPTQPRALDPAARSRLRTAFGETRLELSALMVNLSLVADDREHRLNLDALADAARLGRDLAPGRAPIIETVLGGKPDEWDTVKTQMRDRLGDWARLAAQERVTLAVKAHVGNAVNTPERLLWLLDAVGDPRVKVGFDQSHFEAQGIPLAESLPALLARTAFLHLKDATRDGEKVKFLLPGEGSIDHAAYFRALRQRGFSGPAIVEVSGQISSLPGYDPIRTARTCFARMSAALAKG